MYLLDACEKFFAGELDQIVFEEHLRWFFGNKVRGTQRARLLTATVLMQLFL